MAQTKRPDTGRIPYMVSIEIFKFFLISKKFALRPMGTSKWYNLVPVKDNCTLFSPIPLISDPGYPMVSFKFLPSTPVAMATNFETKLSITRPHER